MEEKHNNEAEIAGSQAADKAAPINWAQKLKLNYPRTMLIGLAFFAISLFWQVYDFLMPLIWDTYFHDTFAVGWIMAADNILALIMLPIIGWISDRVDTRHGKRMPFVVIGTILAVVFFILFMVADGGKGDGSGNVVLMLVFLIFCLISMSAYRSPAVALMPDLTPKPLRSKANAIINIMGTVGGMIAVLALIPMWVSSTKDAEGNGILEGYNPLIFIVVGAIMIISVVALFFTIKEKKVKQEVEKECLEKGYDPKEEEQELGQKTKLSKKQKVSLILMLLSIFFWFMGYNAVTTYASSIGVKYWGEEIGKISMMLTIAIGAAFVGAIPAGILGSKIGRKWTIVIGVVILIAGFGTLMFFKEYNPIMNVFFAVIGIGWATINVNSFPMVVEMAKGSDVGKYTGMYYFFSMGAQTLTPVFFSVFQSEKILNLGWGALFPYATIFVVFSLITMLFVRHGDGRNAAAEMSVAESLELMESKR